jgi:hypothetical protein
LVAAAAMVGGIASITVPAAQAGTVAVKGDTAVNLYGFIRYEAGYTNDMGSFYDNIPAFQSTEKNFESNAKITRIGLTFKNADANVSGRIEGDFWHGNYRLRRAYVQHDFDNFYVKAGQEWGIETINTFSAAWVSPAGFNGHIRMPQVQLGSKFDLGGANLTAKLAFEDANYTGSQYVRKTVPNIVANISTSFDTGFGKPANVYVWGLATPMKVDYGMGEKSKTPVAFAAGFVLPVSMVTLEAEYLYGKGLNGLAGSDYTPASYDSTGNANKFYAWNVEAKIKPVSCLSIAAGYDYLKFKDDNTKFQSYFANLAYNTTKYTKLVLEWDHVKAKGFSEVAKDKGDRYFLSYTYSF